MDDRYTITSPRLDILSSTYQINEVYLECYKQMCLDELATGLVAGAAAIYAFGIKGVIKFLHMAIVMLSKIIVEVIKKIGELIGLLSKIASNGIMGKAVSESYETFIDGVMLEHSQPVSFIGWSMEYDLERLLSIIESDVAVQFNGVMMNDIISGKDVFDSYMDMKETIAEHRSILLNIKNVDLKLTMTDFAKIFRASMFGIEKRELSYSFDQAAKLHQINETRFTRVDQLMKRMSINCKMILKNLNTKMAQIDKMPELVSSMKDNFKVQFSWLMEYITVITEDYVNIFHCITKYVVMVRHQTAAICAKAQTI